MSDGKLNYRDTTKIEIDRNYKFAYLVLALSIGIPAFTLENITPDKDTFIKWFLYVSWALLFIAFLSSFLRIYHLQKSFSKINRELAPDKQNENNKELWWYEKLVVDEKYKFGGITYIIMMVCFGSGIISFITYKVLEIIFNNNTIHVCMHKCLNL